jgi:hypothetical protein
VSARASRRSTRPLAPPASAHVIHTSHTHARAAGALLTLKTVRCVLKGRRRLDKTLVASKFHYFSEILSFDPRFETEWSRAKYLNARLWVSNGLTGFVIPKFSLDHETVRRPQDTLPTPPLL